MIVANAKAALMFRQYAILADIGICLDFLSDKMCVYLKDQAILSSAIDDSENIKVEADKWKINIPFHALEHYPSQLRRYKPSFREQYRSVYEETEPMTGKYQHFQRMAHRFIKDPAALAERRLPKSSTSQR